MSFLLRDNPDGYINGDVVEWITWQLGPIPVAFIALVVVAVACEYVLRRTRLAGDCGPSVRTKSPRAGSASGSMAPSSSATSPARC